MTHPITGIDHVFLLTADLDQAAASYVRLGFTVSPRGLHSEHKGTANHTVMLEGDYFELLGVIRETTANAPQREKLEAQGEGLAAIACRVGDLSNAKAALAERGLATSEILNFERPVALPGGGTGRAAFSTATFAPYAVPHGHVFMCEHLTRDMVWLPELMYHTNGALRLAGVVAAVADPNAAAQGYARLFAAGAVTPVEGGAAVMTGNAPVTFLEDPALRARYPGIEPPRADYAALRILVADLSLARRVIELGGAATHPTASGFAVGPAAAAGAILEFIA